jgi:hypothetical protein
MRIDKDIPVGEIKASLKEPLPFKKMEVGDSIFVPEELMSPNAARIRTGTFAKGPHMKPFTKFVTRTVIEGELSGVRIWLVNKNGNR